MRRLLLVLLTSVLLWVPSPLAQGQEAESLSQQLEAARHALVTGLQAHAQWCMQRKAYGKRDEAYESLLEHDPEHAEARRWLRYERNRDGLWEQLRSYRRPSNPSKAIALEADAAQAALSEAWLAAQVRACVGARTFAELLQAERHLGGLATRFPSAAEISEAERLVLLALYRLSVAAGEVTEVERLQERLTGRWPLDIEVRGSLGEVLREERWVLAESARTLDGSSGLGEATEAALLAAEEAATDSAPTPLEGQLDLPWSSARKTADVRVAGTAEAATLQKLAVIAQAAGPVLAAALGTPPSRRGGFTVYAFLAPEHLETFLAAYPVMNNATLEQRKALNLALVWADGQTMVIDGVVPIGQYDLCANTLLNQLLSDSLLEGQDLAGWHAEGIVRYLAYRMTGTRFSVQMATGRYASGEAAQRSVPASEDAWLMAAHALASKPGPLDLMLRLGKGLDAFTAQDATLTYAFAVYLLEGQPGLLRPFLLSVRKTTNADRAAREILGMPLAVVEYRFRRWLSEVATPGTNQR